MIILNQNQIKQLIPLSEIEGVVEEVEKAFRYYGQGKIQMPPKSYLYFKEHNGDLRIMPAFAPDLRITSTKIVNVHPNNPAKNLPTVMGTIILNDAQTGLLLALMDGTYITGLRTGASGAVAVKYLAREDAKTLGVVGAGEQALFQIAAISKVKEIERIFVYDINQDNIDKLSQQLKEINIEIENIDLEKAANQDIVVTATPSREPIIKREFIKRGTHINAIGADAQGKEELEPSILQEAKIVIDNWGQASHHGEINVPLEKGIIKKEDVYASLSEIVNSQKEGRKNNEEITVFDSTGLAIQDLFTANLVYNIAKDKKIGEEINLL